MIRTCCKQDLIMRRQSERYPFGRAFPIIFISFFLGGVWGFTAVAVLGIVALASPLGELGWHLLAGATLVFSLYFVGKVAGRTAENADVIELRWSQTDRIISVLSFSVAYILSVVINARNCHSYRHHPRLLNNKQHDGRPLDRTELGRYHSSKANATLPA